MEISPDLITYIITYFGHLMTEKEVQARRNLITRPKIAGANRVMQAMLVNSFYSDDPEVEKLLKDGEEAFLRRTAERILREEQHHLVFNLCPKCGSICRTPTAQQCPKCFYSWHD